MNFMVCEKWIFQSKGEKNRGGIRGLWKINFPNWSKKFTGRARKIVTIYFFKDVAGLWEISFSKWSEKFAGESEVHEKSIYQSEA